MEKKNLEDCYLLFHWRGNTLAIARNIAVELGETSEIVLEFPLALQEMVVAVWLIVKGFNPTAIAAGFATGE